MSNSAITKSLELFGGRKLAGFGREEPFFILGSGRSGNTLLRRLIMTSAEAYIPPETYVLGRVISFWKRAVGISWDHRVRTVIGYFCCSQDAASFPQVDFHEVLMLARAIPRPERSLAAVLDLIYSGMAKAAGYRADVPWGDKTPMNTMCLPGIEKTFPHARFIHLIRDPVDASASYVAMGRYDDPIAAAQRWIDANEACMNLFSRTGRGRFMPVRYEEMVRYPEETIDDLCAFLGLQRVAQDVRTEEMGDVGAREHHARVFAPVDSSSIGKGYKALAPEDIRRIEEMTARMRDRIERVFF